MNAPRPSRRRLGQQRCATVCGARGRSRLPPCQTHHAVSRRPGAPTRRRTCRTKPAAGISRVDPAGVHANRIDLPARGGRTTSGN
jgi:hypothetical protein